MAEGYNLYNDEVSTVNRVGHQDLLKLYNRYIYMYTPG